MLCQVLLFPYESTRIYCQCLHIVLYPINTVYRWCETFSVRSEEPSLCGRKRTSERWKKVDANQEESEGEKNESVRVKGKEETATSGETWGEGICQGGNGNLQKMESDTNPVLIRWSLLSLMLFAILYKQPSARKDHETYHRNRTNYAALLLPQLYSLFSFP